MNHTSFYGTVGSLRGASSIRAHRSPQLTQQTSPGLEHVLNILQEQANASSPAGYESAGLGTKRVHSSGNIELTIRDYRVEATSSGEHDHQQEED